MVFVVVIVGVCMCLHVCAWICLQLGEIFYFGVVLIFFLFLGGFVVFVFLRKKLKLGV